MPKKYKVKDQWGREIGEAVEVSDVTDEAAGCLFALILALLIGALIFLVKFVLIPLLKLLARWLQRVWASPTGRAWLLMLLSALGIMIIILMMPTPLGSVWTVVNNLDHVLSCALGGTCFASRGAAWVTLLELLALGAGGGLALWQIGQWVGLQVVTAGPNIGPPVRSPYHRSSPRPGRPRLRRPPPVLRPPSRPSVPRPPRRKPASGGRVEKPRKR